MKIKVCYFGKLAEITSCKSEEINTSVIKISDLIKQLEKNYPPLKTEIFRVSQNKELVDLSTQITGEEIALLPPFSGG